MSLDYNDLSIDHERLHIFIEKKTCQVKLPPEHQMHSYANDNPPYL